MILCCGLSARSFPVESVTRNETGGVEFVRTLDGEGYLYRMRPNGTYGAWQLKSPGLPDLPYRFEPSVEHSRGLVRSGGYWGRMILDVF